ncbi:MAG TPA: glutamate racemase [Candidatus Mcinerneyibacteriales bacterium]|mgnify:CR=1 FL=1|nr:glutamate racemase [Candidatus Mcinerneyibacteriales bacterium]
MPIVVFDSGMGGITVLHEALRLLPGQPFLYYADTGHVPYGGRPAREVRSLVMRAVDVIVRREIPRALVVACNTATSVAIDDLRRACSFPVIGMEPAVKPALEHEKVNGRRVLVLATALTLSQQKYSDLVSRLDGEGLVDSLSLPGLVDLVENEDFAPEQVKTYLREAFSGISREDYGTVVLGCTHFPFFRQEISSFFSPHADIIDGNRGTVLQLIRRLSPVPEKSGDAGDVMFMSSGETDRDREKFRRLLTRYQRSF